MPASENTKNYPLRLSKSLEESIRAVAQNRGCSVNFYIELAIAEKLARERSMAELRTAPTQPQLNGHPGAI